MRRSLIASLIIHALVALWMVAAPPRAGDDAFPSHVPESLEVRTLSPKDFEKELRDALDEKQTQVVSGDDQFETPVAGERKGLTFLSKKNQKVDHETQAAKVDKFRNSKNPGGGGSARKVDELFRLAAQTPPEGSNSRGPASVEKSAPTGRLRAPASLGAGAGDEPESATDDYLRDIAIGTQTILNTREYRFYSFYERVREKLHHEWRRRLNSAYESILAANEIQGRAEIGLERQTQVMVQLSATGELRSVRVIGTSGLREFDAAATDSFRGAAPFPNPPTGMLDADKDVRLRWDFIVVTDETRGIRMNVKREPGF